MEHITLGTQTLFSDLDQLVQDADFTEQFDRSGTFKKKRRGKRYYWYWNVWRGDRAEQRYVGPVTDAAVTARVKRFEQLSNDFDQRRRVVRALVAAGLPEADAMTGMVVEALVRAGFFRLRGVLVGSTAYQCYAGILGVRLKAALIRTQDADFAQYFAIANQIDDAMPSMLEALRTVDATFRPVPHVSDPIASTAFVNEYGYKVEFLTPNRGSDDYLGKPARMPALGGVAAEPLRFLDFLIRDPVRSVLLHEAGLPVIVPAPERYAIHKLIVAERRHDQSSSKVDKDVAQAAHLIEAMAPRRAVDLSSAWQEAWERGPHWRDALIAGASRLKLDARQALATAVKAGAVRRRKDSAAFWPEGAIDLES